MTHECPHGQCTLQVDSGRLACRPHWYQLPKELRAEVWAAYRVRTTDPARHRRAVVAAMTWYRENT